MVTVIEKKPGYNSSEDQFYATDHNGEAVRCRWARNDSSPYDSGNLPTGSDSYNLPNTKFWLADLPTEPILSLNPISLDYGQVEATVEKTLVVTAKNNGGGTLVINDIIFSNDVFSVKNATFPISLGIGQSYDFQVSFIPNEIQLEEGTATFVVDESVPGNKVVNLTGRGLRFGVLRESFEGTLFPLLAGQLLTIITTAKAGCATPPMPLRVRLFRTQALPLPVSMFMPEAPDKTATTTGSSLPK